MGKKNDRKLTLMIWVPTVLLWIVTILTAQFSYLLFTIELIVTACFTIIAIMQVYSLKKTVREYITHTTNQFESLGKDSMAKFPIPILVTNFEGEISWYNNAFFERVLGGEEIYGLNLKLLFDEDTANDLIVHTNASIEWGEHFYKVTSFKSKHRSNETKMYFFYDDTAHHKLNALYERTKMAAMFIQIDGLDFMLKNTLESQKNEILGAIDREIETAIPGNEGYIQKIATDKYIVFLQKSSVDNLKEQKFPILKSVRSLQFGEKGGLTLSIGVGSDNASISACVEQANSALDMAVSRGGDQAVIKLGKDYEFFGGVKQAAQINSRVRTRVVASTLKKMILGSDDVLIMGHSFSDMDSFGSALALCKTVRGLKKHANIVIDRENTLSSALIDYVAKLDTYSDYMISPTDALRKIGTNTLLIIVDTHRKVTVECPELYDKARITVVIDHHRKATDCIDNALLFYHDPSASSACEMVAELIEYIGASFVGRVEAEVLLAGIMLDTRNFVMRTSSRTFESLAFLRSQGADPVEVKRFFADSMETYKFRSQIVSRAQLYGDCAISYTLGNNAEIRMAAAQAADELLTISGVGASFVMYGGEGDVNISARSYGSLNVQLVMEQLGGGGHQTMAAVQLQNTTFELAAADLIDAIGKVREQI